MVVHKHQNTYIELDGEFICKKKKKKERKKKREREKMMMMSEKEKEIEEEGILDHWSHEEHPLTLVEPRHDTECYCCGLHFRGRERAYGCSKQGCAYTNILHEECAEMPAKITHSRHRHTLIAQQAHSMQSLCASCYLSMGTGIGYKCTSSECKFGIHMKCAQAFGMMEAADELNDGDGSCTNVHRHHPNYPNNHQLRLFEKRSSFKCDACGITGRGKSCICTSCGYWIHERCASLPQTIERPGVHHHSLSLCFRVPTQYLRYRYKCEVCNKALIFKYWIYHCQLCSIAVHINCAFKIKTTMKNVLTEEGVIRLPANDVAEGLIRPFLTRQGIAPAIPPPPDDDDDKMANVKTYKFSLHEHQLSLISSSSSSSSHHDHNKDSDTDDEEEYDWGKRPELMCDGCITPIFSSSSSSGKSSYMSCGECSYNLHLACFDLPPRLPSLPIHNEPEGHELVLIKSGNRLKPWEYGERYCRVCGLITNGLMYRCQECSFVADIKCASLPHTVHHAAHPHRLLNLLTPYVADREGLRWRKCAADCTGDPWLGCSFCYADTDYEFVVHARCAMLPASTVSRRWDKKHRLVLTYDANLNHPGEFYCDECERKMNPKRWMYHCRDCDLSFHPECFWTTSGDQRNFKFGQVCSILEAHPHSLTYQLLTTKRRCDTCRRNCYGSRGFRCEPCDFFICLGICGWKMVQAGQVQLVE